MLKFTAIGPASGDCTTPYAVEWNRAGNVADFIHDVLSTLPDEFGSIAVRIGEYPYPECRYRRGRIESALPADILRRNVLAVSARAGWGLTDYVLVVSEDCEICGRS